MTYRVILMPNAIANLTHYHDYAAKRAPQTAARWLERFQAAIETLSELPERWPIAAETSLVSAPVRPMLFGKGRNVYRVLFSIVGNEVRVLHVRRAAIDIASLEELLGDLPTADAILT
jgi:plasmid stabilization system protein ParE